MKSTTTKKTAPKKAAAKKATKKKEPACLFIEENGKVINFHINGDPGDLVSMLKDCMNNNETFAKIVKVAVIL